MKKIEIIIGGTGHEITRSNFTSDEVKKLDEYCKENDTDRESALSGELDEIFEDRYMWYECDDLGHFVGGNLGCKLYVSVDDDEYEFETKDVEIEEKSIDYPDLEDGTMVSFVTSEKGTMDKCEFELGDDEEFDIKKLKLEVSKIETPNSYYDIITGWSYDGKSLEGEGVSDTTGKAFDVEIEGDNPYDLDLR